VLRGGALTDSSNDKRSRSGQVCNLPIFPFFDRHHHLSATATSRSCGCQDWVGPAASDANFSEPDLTASLWQHFHRSGVTRPADMNEAGAD
jgi:hypothetical protein